MTTARPNKSPLCVFTYHEIHNTPSRYRYGVTEQQLREHLAFFSRLAHHSPGELIPHISFDDGHKSNYQDAFPLLEEFGIKATFFVVAGRIGRDPEFMTWKQARELVTAGHRVESHGWTHRLLTVCDETDSRQEIAASKSELEDRLGTAVRSISAPGGRWNEQVISACSDAGYTRFFHSNPWIQARQHAGVYIQGRHMVTMNMGETELADLLHMSPVRALLQRAKYLTKEQLRLALGDAAYHTLWTKLARWSSTDGIELDVSKPSNNERETRHL